MTVDEEEKLCPLGRRNGFRSKPCHSEGDDGRQLTATGRRELHIDGVTTPEIAFGADAVVRPTADQVKVVRSCRRQKRQTRDFIRAKRIGTEN